MSRWPFERRFRPGQIRSDADADIREEIELYLDLRAQELEEEGLPPDEARRVARERFGKPEQVEDELRRQAHTRRTREGTTVMMSGLKQDLGYAVRTLRRSPGFTAVAVLTLGLALGGNTAIFSVVDAALLQALPFEDHERLVFVNGVHVQDGEPAFRGASYPEFRDWRERARSIDGMSAVANFEAALTGDGTAERAMVEVVSEDYFDLLGVRPLVGRLFQPDEYALGGAQPVAIVSEALFERRFEGDPSALGQQLIVNDIPLTVVGVVAEAFGGIALDAELWVPEPMISLGMSPEILDSRGSRFLNVVGRLSAGTDVEAAQAELEAIGSALEAEYPRAHEDRSARLQGFRDGYLGDTGQLLWVFLGAGALLLLIAAANVANLLLVRAHGRTKEIVLRRALGAGGRRIAGQLLTESATLAVMGGVLGLFVASSSLSLLTPLIPDGVLPGYVEPRLSPAAFVFSLVALGVVGLGIGLVPAASSARVDLASRLRQSSKVSAGGPGRFRPQHVFVVAQVSMALALMVGAGLLTRSFQAQLGVDTGVEYEGVGAMSLQLPRTRYDTDEAVRAFDRELERRLALLPGVSSVSLSSDLPFRNGSSGAYIFREGDGPDDRIRFHYHAVSPGFFETIGVELLRGRFLDETDVEGALPVVVITETMERRVYPDESAVGKTMYLRPDGTLPAEVVGVIADVRFRDVTTSLFADANSPDAFFPLRQRATLRLEAAVRTTAELSTVLPMMRSTVNELDPNLPVAQLAPMAEAFRTETAMPRFAAFLMTIFSVLAAVVACVGIYGILAFSVGQRSREIAIRRAIGATGGSVARSVVGDGVKLAAAGMVVGAGVAMFGSSVLEAFLFQVERSDPTTFVVVGLGMVAFALVAAIVPAVRATRRQPAEALKAD